MLHTPSLLYSVADINQSLIDDGLVDKEKLGGSNYFWSFPAKKDRVAQLQHEKVLGAIQQLKSSIDEAHAALQDAKRGREENDVPAATAVHETSNEEEESNMDKEETKATTGQESSKDNGGGDDGTKEAPDADGAMPPPPPAKKLKTVAALGRAAKLLRLDEIAKQRAAAVAELDALKENDPQALADLEKELQLVQQAANRWTDNIFNCKTYLTKKRGMDKKEALKILGITGTFDCTYVLHYDSRWHHGIQYCISLSWTLCGPICNSLEKFSPFFSFTRFRRPR